MMEPRRPIDHGPAITVLTGAAATARNYGGNSQGQKAADYSNAIKSEPGLDVTRGIFSMIMVAALLIGLAVTAISLEKWGAPAFLQATLGNWFVVLILLIFGALSFVGIGVGIYITLPHLIGVKMRARFYGINSAEAYNAGSIYSSPPIVILLYTAVAAPLFFTLVYPFFLIQNVFEIFRVTIGTLKGQSISLRGDSGIYYDRMRKEYAKLKALGASQSEAEDMLRKASLGMFTAKTKNIDLASWMNGERDRVLGTMIQRHGPVDAYVGKVTVTGEKAGVSTNPKDRNQDGIARKYSAF